MKKRLISLLTVVAVMGLTVGSAMALGNSKLIVRNNGNTADAYKVTDAGEAVFAGTGGTAGTRDISMQNAAQTDNLPSALFYPISSGLNAGAAFQLSPKGTGFSAGIKSQLSIFNTDYVADPANVEVLVIRAAGANGFSINSLTTGTGMTLRPINFQIASANKMTIATNGYVGVGTTSPARLLTVGSGGAGSDGSTWFTSSSREYKDNIQTLSAEKAMEAVKNMNPVTFNYKEISPEYTHVGFIAEDVPNLVATPDRKSLSAMDIVAVLTKVVQEQNKAIEVLSAKVEMLEKASK